MTVVFHYKDLDMESLNIRTALEGTLRNHPDQCPHSMGYETEE